MERPIKVAFVGTSSIGKSTLLEWYRRKFKNDPSIAIVDEAAREYFTTHPEVTERFSEIAQGQVQDLALINERAALARSPRRIICDRSVLDAVAYVRSTGDIAGSNRLLDRVLTWIPTYSTLLLLNPDDVPFMNDSIRKENLATRQLFHQTFLDLFQEKRIPYQILSGSFRQRVRMVNEILEI